MKITFNDNKTVEVSTAYEAMHVIYDTMSNAEIIEFAPQEEAEAIKLDNLVHRYCQNLRIKKPTFKIKPLSIL